MRPINWLWLEKLLIRACEDEIREFGLARAGEPFFAFCLEFDGLAGSLSAAFGTRSSVDAAFAAQDEAGEGALCYRCVELRSENWQHRGIAIVGDAENHAHAEPILQQYREAMNEAEAPEVTEFLWLRFEYLADCVVRGLVERDAFRPLPREPEFVAYAANEHESLEELEDRLSKLYPSYRRATAEFTNVPRMGEEPGSGCDGDLCGGSADEDELLRCTYCGGWFCAVCQMDHLHPELYTRLPLLSQSSR